MREIIKEVQAPFAVTTVNQILKKPAASGQDVFFQNNHASAITYLNLSDFAGYALDFTSGGTTEISVGDEVEGETGGATGNVVKVDLVSGTWAGGNAVGVIWVDTLVGDFQSETLKVGASLNLATITAVQDATRMITVQPAGGVFFRENITNTIYVIGSAAHYVVRSIGKKSGQA
ncbi:hypothetical protein KAR10_10310 [bacterium]|nr:hypothetical protein [bacterium]